MQDMFGSGCRLSRWLVLLAGIACVVPAPADAQSNDPNRPVRILVPYGPGGVADTAVRLLAQKLNERLGQQFIIENRPGALQQKLVPERMPIEQAFFDPEA